MSRVLQKAMLVVAIVVSSGLVWVSHQILGTGVLLRSIGLLDGMALALLMVSVHRMFHLAAAVLGLAVILSGLEGLVADWSTGGAPNAVIAVSAGLLAVAATDFGREILLVRREFLALGFVCLTSSVVVVWFGQSLLRTWVCVVAGLALWSISSRLRTRRGRRLA